MNSDMFTRNGSPVYLASCVFELSESLTYVTSPQGGFHTLNSQLVHLRLQGEANDFEMIDDSIIITFAARDIQPDGSKGNDPDMFAKRIRVLEDALQAQRPVAVITSAHHQSLRFHQAALPAGEEWAVTGFFVVRDYWVHRSEPCGRTLMVAFQLIVPEPEGPEDLSCPWWYTDQAAPNVETVQDEGTCSECGGRLVRRFREGEVLCGRPTCPSNVYKGTKEKKGSRSNRGFVKASRKKKDAGDKGGDNGRGKNSTPLRDPRDQYLPAYLESIRNLPTNDIDLSDFDLLPPAPARLTPAQFQAVAAGSGNQKGWRGYVCMVCGRFNRRVNWSYLKCRHCDNKLDIGYPNMQLEQLIDSAWLNVVDSKFIKDQFKIVPGFLESWEEVDLTSLGLQDRYFAFRFNLHDGNYVVVAYPRNTAIFENGGYRDQFNGYWQAMQSGQIDLARRFVNPWRAPGQMTGHFAENYSVDYHINAELGTSIAMEDAAPILLQISDELSRVVKLLNGGQDPGFNELLLASMAPGMKMGFHSDGETQVMGHTISSVSFGGPATMSFGLRRELEKGMKFSQLFEIIPGCLKFDEKTKLQQEYDDLKASSNTAGSDDHQKKRQAEFDAKLRKICKGCIPKDYPKPQLSFPIPGTGAIVIQSGATLNKLYAHQVELEPKSMARMVVTARQLGAPTEQTKIRPGSKPAEPKKAASQKKPATKQTKSTKSTSDKPKPAKKAAKNQQGTSGVVPGPSVTSTSQPAQTASTYLGTSGPQSSRLRRERRIMQLQLRTASLTQNERDELEFLEDEQAMEESGFRHEDQDSGDEEPQRRTTRNLDRLRDLLRASSASDQGATSPRAGQKRSADDTEEGEEPSVEERKPKKRK